MFANLVGKYQQWCTSKPSIQ